MPKDATKRQINTTEVHLITHLFTAQIITTSQRPVWHLVMSINSRRSAALAQTASDTRIRRRDEIDDILDSFDKLQQG